MTGRRTQTLPRGLSKALTRAHGHGSQATRKAAAATALTRALTAIGRRGS